MRKKWIVSLVVVTIMLIGTLIPSFANENYDQYIFEDNESEMILDILEKSPLQERAWKNVKNASLYTEYLNSVNSVNSVNSAHGAAPAYVNAQIPNVSSGVSNNEYRIALRVGSGYVDNRRYWDYHFMRQTNTGSWCEQRGGSISGGGQCENYNVSDPGLMDWHLWNSSSVEVVGFYYRPTVYMAVRLY